MNIILMLFLAIFAVICAPRAHSADAATAELLTEKKHPQVRKSAEEIGRQLGDQDEAVRRDTQKRFLALQTTVSDYPNSGPAEDRLLEAVTDTGLRAPVQKDERHLASLRFQVDLLVELLSGNGYTLSLPPAEKAKAFQGRIKAAAPVAKLINELTIPDYKPQRVGDYSGVIDATGESRDMLKKRADESAQADLQNNQQSALKSMGKLLFITIEDRLPLAWQGTGERGRREAARVLDEMGLAPEHRDAMLAKVDFGR